MLFCTLERLKEAIEKELNTPGFLSVQGQKKEYFEARSIYVFFAVGVLNYSFTEVRKSIPYYQNQKTVYQVFRRQYNRRKQFDHNWLINRIKTLIDGRR